VVCRAAGGVQGSVWCARQRVVCRAACGVQGSVWCAGQRESRDNAQHLDNLLEARRQRMAEFAGGFSWATRVSVSVSVSVRARM
jgi:hypothetical protein